MRIHELEHVIRAAADVADEDDIVVVGSQAILGSRPDAPAVLLVSVEADVFPRNHPGRSSTACARLSWTRSRHVHAGSSR